MRFSILIFTLSIFCISCKENSKTKKEIPEVHVTGQMKDVMWKGKLFGKLKLDTITKDNTYGLGPESYLTGEVLINNGNAYVSKVLSDSSITVLKTTNIEAPFFVYSHVKNWQKLQLPDSITSSKSLENYISFLVKDTDESFAFKLHGSIKSAQIHIQNLPFGTKVSSPKEAHQGQVNYDLKNEIVDIVGFYSKHHQGIFTHHDSFTHMHLITQDETKMGHLDTIVIDKLDLFLPSEIPLNKK